MNYVLKVYYQTGDSFHHEDTHETVDYEWRDEDVARENAKAITEHYNAYFREHTFGWCGGKPDKSYKGAWWYKPADWNGADIGPVIRLKLDDGRLVDYCCPWCGFFESLHYVEVAIKEMIFYPEVGY